LERMWREVVVVLSVYLPVKYQKGFNKTVRIVSVPAEIRPEHLQNISLESVTDRPTCSVTHVLNAN
jgi:hypothetical protein